MSTQKCYSKTNKQERCIRFICVRLLRVGNVTYFQRRICIVREYETPRTTTASRCIAVYKQYQGTKKARKGRIPARSIRSASPSTSTITNVAIYRPPRFMGYLRQYPNPAEIYHPPQKISDPPHKYLVSL